MRDKKDRYKGPLPESITAVDDQRRAGHVARGVTRQIDCQGAKIVRLAKISDRNLRAKGLDDFWMFPSPALVGLGNKTAWADGVRCHAVRRPVSGDTSSELQECGFRSFIVAASDPAANHKTVDGTNIDNPTPTLLDHR